MEPFRTDGHLTDETLAALARRRASSSAGGARPGGISSSPGRTVRRFQALCKWSLALLAAMRASHCRS